MGWTYSKTPGAFLRERSTNLNLETAVAKAASPGSAFFRRDFQLLRSFTLRVRVVESSSGCCAARQTAKNDGLSYGEAAATPGSSVPSTK